MSRHWDSDTWEAGAFDRGSQTSWVAEANSIFTRRPGGGAIHSRLALATSTVWFLSGELIHHSAGSLRPSVTGSNRVLTSVNGVKISSAQVLNLPLLLLEPVHLVHCPRPGQVANSFTPPHTHTHTALKDWPWLVLGLWTAVEASQGPP